MRRSQEKHRQFQQQLFEYFSRKDNCTATIGHKIVTAEETDKELSFTYFSDHSCIVHSYEFSLNTDLTRETSIDAFIHLLSSHNRIHHQPNQSYN